VGGITPIARTPDPVDGGRQRPILQYLGPRPETVDLPEGSAGAAPRRSAGTLQQATQGQQEHEATPLSGLYKRILESEVKSPCLENQEATPKPAKNIEKKGAALGKKLQPRPA
jgi:hypothetical protein